MDPSLLSGTDAAVAVRSYMVLGNRGARFDRARVALALRTAAGRNHLARTLRRPDAPRALVSRAAARTVRTARRRRGRALRASGRVGTPSRQPGPEPGGR